MHVMCVCMYICIYVSTDLIYASMIIYVHVPIYVFMYMDLHKSICNYSYNYNLCIYASMNLFIYVFIYLMKYLCSRASMYICIIMYL